MSEKHSTKSRTKRAAALYRSSDDKQENSIDRQRGSVIPYAASKDYQLVAEYEFEGIAGDKIGLHPK
jgi:hypothetical protein